MDGFFFTYEWVMSHIWMIYVSHILGSSNARGWWIYATATGRGRWSAADCTQVSQMCTCMYARMYVFIFVCMYVGCAGSAWDCTQVAPLKCVHIWLCVRMYECMCICMCMSMCVWAYIYVYTCMYVCTFKLVSKSPMSPQKCPMSPQKSPISLKKSPYVCVCKCVYVCMCVCVCVCVCVYVCASPCLYLRLCLFVCLCLVSVYCSISVSVSVYVSVSVMDVSVREWCGGTWTWNEFRWDQENNT